jgi:hypothetical protein
VVVLRLAVVLAALGFLVRGIRWSDVRFYLHDVRPALLVGVVGLNATMMGIKAARLRLLLAPGNATLSSCFRALLTSSAINNVAPLRAGDVARLWMLERSAGVTKVAAAAASVIERLVDIGALGLLAIGPSLHEPSRRWAAVAAPVVLATTVGLLWALRSVTRAPSRRERLAAGAQHRPRWLTKLSELRDSIAGGAAVLRNRRRLASTVGLSLAAWITETLMVVTCAKALRLDVTTPIAIVTLLGINLALALPSTPSGAGPFEASAVIVLTAAGIPKPAAIAFALSYHLIQVFPVTVVGFAVLALERSRQTRSRGGVTAMEEVAFGAIPIEIGGPEVCSRDAGSA